LRTRLPGQSLTGAEKHTKLFAPQCCIFLGAPGSLPDLLQNCRVLNFLILSQQQHLRNHLRSLRIVIRERQEQPPTMLRVYRYDADTAAGLTMHSTTSQMHVIGADLPINVSREMGIGPASKMTMP
jgi:hypothetical protein